MKVKFLDFEDRKTYIRTDVDYNTEGMVEALLDHIDLDTGTEDQTNVPNLSEYKQQAITVFGTFSEIRRRRVKGAKIKRTATKVL